MNERSSLSSPTGRAAQVGQRGHAGTEVVDRDEDTEIAELLDHELGSSELGDERRLGQLEHQSVRGEAVSSSCWRTRSVKPASNRFDGDTFTETTSCVR